MVWCFVIFAIVADSSVAPVSADEVELEVSDKKTKEKVPPVPALSLETLFHPEKRYDYDGKLPATHWVGDDPSVLLVRRGKTWNQVSLDSGDETLWPVVDQLAEQLEQLEGVSAEQANKSALSAVPKMKLPGETLLVRIGKSLAVVSASSPARWLTRDASTWRNAAIDPTSQRVAYTRDGDLYVVDVKTDLSLQLTNDGSDTMLDGVLDWTYQEEIYGRGNYRAFWFSPSGNWLAMLRIDTSGIPPYTLAAASSERGSGIVRRYPKAGDPIPHAGLYIWDLRNFDAGVVPPARLVVESTRHRELLLTGVWWYPTEDGLVYSMSDRLQTWRELRVIGKDFLNGTQQESEILIREESPAWIEPPTPPAWLADGSFIWRSELPTGRSRLYRISKNGRVVVPVSPDNFDVRDYVVQSDTSLTLVTGDAKRGTMERHAYRIDPAGKNETMQLMPLTSEAGWHSVNVSPDGDWMVDRFSSPTMPPQLVLRSTKDSDHFVVAKSELKVIDPIVAPEVFQIKTPDGFLLPAMLLRPSTASKDKPCAVVIEVYGGPQAPSVSTRWSGTKALYRQLLARRGIATLRVDNRSSAGSMADTWSIRHHVGELEMKDLNVAVDWLKKQPWVDSKRLAIRGWSFGGFLTLYAMTHSDAFVAGVAGGSVTDWKEYDAFYTERYMGLPSTNAVGYEATAPVRMAGKMAGKVMLIHGESDDNVHPSNTMRMALALQKEGKDFQLMIYPGAAHSIRNPQQAWHMAQMVDRFLMEELGEKGQDSR